MDDSKFIADIQLYICIYFFLFFFYCEPKQTCFFLCKTVFCLFWFRLWWKLIVELHRPYERWLHVFENNEYETKCVEHFNYSHHKFRPICPSIWEEERIQWQIEISPKTKSIERLSFCFFFHRYACLMHKHIHLSGNLLKYIGKGSKRLLKLNEVGLAANQSHPIYERISTFILYHDIYYI